MIIYLTVEFSKNLAEIPVPSSISLKIDGTSYLCTWDWMDYGKDDSSDVAVVDYRLKGVAVENDNMPETYANGMLKEDSVIEVEEINYEEMDSDEEFKDEIVSLTTNDGDIYISTTKF